MNLCLQYLSVKFISAIRSFWIKVIQRSVHILSVTCIEQEITRFQSEIRLRVCMHRFPSSYSDNGNAGFFSDLKFLDGFFIEMRPLSHTVTVYFYLGQPFIFFKKMPSRQFNASQRGVAVDPDFIYHIEYGIPGETEPVQNA